jgi:hypothetical protein
MALERLKETSEAQQHVVAIHKRKTPMSHKTNRGIFCHRTSSFFLSREHLTQTSRTEAIAIAFKEWTDSTAHGIKTKAMYGRKSDSIDGIF